MASFKIKKGFDIRLEGKPALEVTDAVTAGAVRVYPQEWPGLKPRLSVAEGDTVKRGSALFCDKQQEALIIRSPAGGTVRSIVRGARRALTEIHIDVAGQEETEVFPRYSGKQIRELARDQVLNHLLNTGFLAFIRQRPFSVIADPAVTPKAIFVNAMNTAPFQADPAAVLQGEGEAFQAGLDVLTRLTDGTVHVCGPDHPPAAVTQAERVERHVFSGPHPSGNTSVHIHHIAPIAPGDTVWTTRVEDVVAIGHLFLNGEVPATKVVSIGGPGVSADARKHYRVRIGQDIGPLLSGHESKGEQRIISGTLLAGTQVPADSAFRTFDSSLTVLPEGRERHFLGWLAPGLCRFSASRLFLSRWFRPGATWALNTNKNGSDRALVVTGLYDRFMPMRIRVDALVRAVLAHDTDEAVQLGLLETDPEDFALCAFACPSKMDIPEIIRKGLEEVALEGL